MDSKELFLEAAKVIPGGVNSPVRAFKSVEATPVFMDRAEGAYLYDQEGRAYLDYIGSWGPMILGHQHPEVINAIKQQLEKGVSFGTVTVQETRLAQAVKDLMPHMEMLRLVSSGTEACMSVLRLARAYTGRDKIVKFEGCYHGHADMLLVEAGSGVATLGIAGSPGVPKGAIADTLVAPYNDLGAIEEIFSRQGEEIAAVILEPICGNAGFIRPRAEFIQGLKKVCTDHGALLIFDEVMTGFRVAKGGAQSLLGVVPDLTTLGKVIGGGLPIGAYGGRRDIMEQVAPSGSVYQAGTLSGNPLSVASGLKTLEWVARIDYEALQAYSHKLLSGMKEICAEKGVPFSFDCEGGMFGFRFMEAQAQSFAEAKEADIEQFKRFFRGMLAQGIYFAPSAFEAGFVSIAHKERELDKTLAACQKVFHT